MKMTELEEFKDEIEGSPVLCTGNAIIAPRKVTVDGTTYWFWVVESFEGDSYYDGKVCNPLEYSETKRGLFAEFEQE